MCDVAGNCTQAGPYAFAVDRSPPVCVASYINFYQVLNADPRSPANLGRFGCGDQGSGLLDGSGKVTADDGSIGYHYLTWTATDRIGNVGTGGGPSFGSYGYIVSYQVKYLYDWTAPVPRGGTQTVTLAPYDANGVNMSSKALVVTASGVPRTDAYPYNRFKYDPSLDGGLGGYRFAFTVDPNTTLGLHGTASSYGGYGFGGLLFQFSDEAATMHLYHGAPYTVG